MSEKCIGDEIDDDINDDFTNFMHPLVITPLRIFQVNHLKQILML